MAFYVKRHFGAGSKENARSRFCRQRDRRTRKFLHSWLGPAVAGANDRSAAFFRIRLRNVGGAVGLAGASVGNY